MSKFLPSLKDKARILVPFLVIVLLIAFGVLARPFSLEFYLSHMGFVLWVLLFLFVRLGWAIVNNQRKQNAMDPKNKMIAPKPMLRPFSQAWRDWFDLTWFVDNKKRRIFNMVSTVVVLAAVIMIPVGRIGKEAPPLTGFEAVSKGWALGSPFGIPGMVVALALPLIWLAVIASRAHAINKEREGSIEMIYNIAASCLKYPRKTTRVRPDEMPFQTPRGAIDVKKWKGMTEPEVFFIAAPITMDINDKESWNTLQANLETKLPSDTGWHFEFEKRGKGATVMPASYPMSVLWDGEQDPDPLTFLLGADLDNPGEFLKFTFGETSPHSATVGGTGSGKTSVTEAIVAQAATKPMPWSDPSDPIYATIYIVDPKGPFANRWQDRPNIYVVNGTRDTVNEDGDSISGIEAMRDMVEKYVEEMNKRGRLIDDHGLAKWLDFSDEILRRERMAPWFICLDEYLDHTDKITGKSEQAERDNMARQMLTEKVLLVARKGRSFGFHIMLIAQTANMTLIGAPLMRQLIARIIMGNMDATTYSTFFGTTEVPVLPTSRVVDGKRKGIPGRGRIMNAPGQEIHRMQAFWFGGKENSDTLDKWLPRKGTSALAGAPEMAEADIDDYDVDENGPTVDLDNANVVQERINEKPVPEPDPTAIPDDEPAPEPKPKPEKKAAPKPPAPKPEKAGNQPEVVEADELFAKAPSTPKTPDAGKYEPCCVCGTTDRATKKCANPKCENYVCTEHHMSPDGAMWACPTCAKAHVLSRMKLGTLYPWIKSESEKHGGTALWTKQNDKVEVSVRIENVEVVKVTGTTSGVEAMDGNGIATTAAEVRKMVSAALR